MAPVFNTSPDGTRDTLPFLGAKEASSPPAEPVVELPPASWFEFGLRGGGGGAEER